MSHLLKCQYANWGRSQRDRTYFLLSQESLLKQIVDWFERFESTRPTFRVCCQDVERRRLEMIRHYANAFAVQQSDLVDSLLNWMMKGWSWVTEILSMRLFGQMDLHNKCWNTCRIVKMIQRTRTLFVY